MITEEKVKDNLLSAYVSQLLSMDKERRKGFFQMLQLLTNLPLSQFWTRDRLDDFMKYGTALSSMDYQAALLSASQSFLTRMEFMLTVESVEKQGLVLTIGYPKRITAAEMILSIVQETLLAHESMFTITAPTLSLLPEVYRGYNLNSFVTEEFLKSNLWIAVLYLFIALGQAEKLLDMISDLKTE
jgi:hypothetical protein